MKNKYKIKGFTLVELLVVIAIMGILSSVAVVSLNSARENAKVAAALYDLSSLQAAIVVCNSGDNELSTKLSVPQCGGVCYCTTDNSIPQAGYSVCDGSTAVWPDLSESGFTYLQCQSNPSAGTWLVPAFNASLGRTIFCSTDGCSEV